MEILFPAGSMKHVNVAIRNRVDAVYGGFKQWNSRDKANNFSLKEYKTVISKLHKHGIRFYLTLNTLMFDEDIKGIIKTLHSKNMVLPDAFIAADVGLIQELKSNFPTVPIHLSTQFGVHDSDDVILAKDLGAERVILSRELTKEKVKEISQKTNLETECFVYGSQCVSFSGQCYFSSLLNGGSGNRGKCEIFCRDKYKVNGQIGDLLYVPDLNCSASIKDLPDVACWKLEGRKRNPDEIGKFIQNLKLGIMPDKQTGYIYGTSLSENNLFNRNHVRSVPLIHTSKYDINGGNISFDIKSSNGFISEIAYIDGQGQGTKFSTNGSREFVTFDIDEFADDVQIKYEKNVYKINCNENPKRFYIDRNIKEKIIGSIKNFNKINSFGKIPFLVDTWVEVDNIEPLNVLTRKYPNLAFVYNINSVKNLQDLIPANNQNVIYKLPMFNFENLNLGAEYKKLENQRVLFTHIGQIKSFEPIELSERITDYTIPVWNQKTLKYLKSKGFDRFTASPELSFEQNEDVLNNGHRNYISYGRLPLVYTRMCFKHLFDCKKCNQSGLKQIYNIDKDLDFDVKCYQDHRVILSKNPILNNYPDPDDKTSYRIVTTGMNLSGIEAILENPGLMKRNSYICNMQTARR